jgi:hypothetical protein
MNITTLAFDVEGMTGDQEHDSAILRRANDEFDTVVRRKTQAIDDSAPGALDRKLAVHSDPEVVTLVRRTGRLSRISRMLTEYRIHVPLQAPCATAATARDRALRLVQTRWEALATAEDWPAAYHAWIAAVDDAGRLIKAWSQAAWAAHPGSSDLEEHIAEVLAEGVTLPKQILEIYRPPETIQMIWEEMYRLTQTLQDEHQRRLRLTQQTLETATQN